MHYAMKKVKSLEHSGPVLKDIVKLIENEKKNKEADFLVCYWV